MTDPIKKYLLYVGGVKRYSSRTQALYKEILEEFAAFTEPEDIVRSLNTSILRSYEVWLLDEKKLGARTVGLRLSVLSGFSRWLVGQGELGSNPVRTLYDNILKRLIISLLYSTGIRRSELIGLIRNSYDLRRKVIRVLGKGDKMREIPLTGTICEEILLYLRAVDKMCIEVGGADFPLLVTRAGGRLYPVFVDRAVKEELGTVPEITSRKSPHVLRHTLATELLDEGTDLNSIKELLGHSSLAATQVYTHNSIEKLKKVYNNAHPRAAKK